MKNAHRKQRRVRRIPPTAGSTVALDAENENETPISPVESSAGTDAPAVKRLTMPVTDDGRIDVTSLREKTKAALRHALSDPSLPSALGMSESIASDVSSAEDSMLIAAITDGVFNSVGLASVLIARRAGYKPEHCAVLAWSSEEKNAVAPLTGKIARKWLPMLDGKYRDECLLGYMVVNIIGAKIMLLRETAAMANKQPPTVVEEAIQ